MSSSEHHPRALTIAAATYVDLNELDLNDLDISLSVLLLSHSPGLDTGYLIARYCFAATRSCRAVSALPASETSFS